MKPADIPVATEAQVCITPGALTTSMDILKLAPTLHLFRTCLTAHRTNTEQKTMPIINVLKFGTKTTLAGATHIQRVY